MSPSPDSPSSGGGNGGGIGSSSGGASPSVGSMTPQSPSRYEAQKRRDWNTFGHYLLNHRPPLSLAQCSGAHVLEFLRYLDQFGKTKVHGPACPFYGHPNPPAPPAELIDRPTDRTTYVVLLPPALLFGRYARLSLSIYILCIIRVCMHACAWQWLHAADPCTLCDRLLLRLLH